LSSTRPLVSLRCSRRRLHTRRSGWEGDDREGARVGRSRLAGRHAAGGQARWHVCGIRTDSGQAWRFGLRAPGLLFRDVEEDGCVGCLHLLLKLNQLHGNGRAGGRRRRRVASEPRASRVWNAQGRRGSSCTALPPWLPPGRWAVSGTGSLPGSALPGCRPRSAGPSLSAHPGPWWHSPGRPCAGSRRPGSWALGAPPALPPAGLRAQGDAGRQQGWVLCMATTARVAPPPPPPP